ncbi:unnamed protein product [Penicillium egyptiacum]|uniref:Carboxymuconolactone decarboxylase-like domain-containing protein n=1 Tax=Penicillium egyptiacum TaxID=1303716 RepID=A0A9W4KHK0_9EURO|nr:unnamed protein product [Penicillium egyptiacum]
MSTSDVDNPTVDLRWSELFATIEAKFKASNIANEKWYLTTLSAITTTPELHLCGQLYLYLIGQHAHSTSTARSELIRRMREALFKEITLVGLPKPLEALLNINKFVSEEDAECSFTREGWQRDDTNHARGMDWLKSIYAHNTSSLLALFKNHPDFGFWVADITYGLVLSDRQVLDDVDTELVVLPAVMGQDMPRTTYWHIRGIRRLGISKEDVGMVMECVRLVVEACNLTLKQVPDVGDVEGDL